MTGSTAPEPIVAVTPAAWDGLLDTCAVGDPLRRMPVLLATCRFAGRPGWFATVRRDGELVAGAPLWPSRERGLVVWRHLGHRLNWFTPAPPTRDDDACRALAQRLLALPGDLVTLADLDPRSALVHHLKERAPTVVRPESATYRVRTVERRASMHRRRREVERTLRRADDRGMPLTVTVTDDGATITSQIDELLALQANAWRDRDGDEMAATRSGRALVAALLTALAGEERLHLVRVESTSRTVGFALSALAGSRAVMFKTAYDRTLSGAGWVGITRSLSSLAERGVEVVDLGSGGDHFKTQMADPEPQVTAQVALTRRGRALLMAGGIARAVRRGG